MDIDLSAKPFFLRNEQIRDVKNILDGMSIDDKIRQLFCLITYNDDEEYCRYIGSVIRPGGFMSRVMPKEEAASAIEKMQKYSDIPLLVAANLESGGNGVIKEGTAFASEMEIGASKDVRNAARLGEVCAVEGKAVGVNMAFSPIVDLDLNFRNPVTNTRTFGSDVSNVKGMGVAYINTLQSLGLAATAKHFPGDGCDERDQHIAPSVNSMSVEEWDASFGNIYSECISAGVKSIMIGHIIFPAYTRFFCPDIKDEDILPSSVNRYIVTSLLRQKLGFGGLIITDSSTMAGLTSLVPRKDAVPMTIAAGCDMFLFTKNLEEDIGYMERGYENGIISRERLDEAVTRILALKMSLGLFGKERNSIFKPEDIGKEKFSRWAHECADSAITLVKEEEDVLPITPERYPRVLFYPLDNKASGESVFGEDSGANMKFYEALVKEGFEVDVFKSVGGFEGMMRSENEIIGNYDLIIYSASLKTRSNQTTVRIEWENPMGANVPIFCHSLPTVFVSFENPYHLLDVPQMRTYINCYFGSDIVIEELMKKLTGKSGFVGVSPVDAFCGKWETKIKYGEKKDNENKSTPLGVLGGKNEFRYF